MTALSEAECRDWCEREGVLECEGDLLFDKKETFRRTVVVPQHSRSLALLSKRLPHQLSTSEEILLWVTEWGIWPSEENVALFRRLLLAYDERRWLSAAPGFVFGAGDRDELEGFIRLVLIFGWGARIVGSGADTVFVVTHDETLEIVSKTAIDTQGWSLAKG